MTSEQPFALHVTWTCYGTWLPGDRRGHVSNTLLPEGGFQPKENTPGTPCRHGDEFTRQRAQTLQRQPTVYLTVEQALVVASSLCQAAQARHWRRSRSAVMANHVHAVLMDFPNDGPAVRRILKGSSQAALNDHVGFNRRWWTAGGSNRYKNDWPAIEAAVLYVADQSGMLASIIDGRAAGFTPAEIPQLTHSRVAVLRLLDRYQVLSHSLALQQVHELLYFLQQAGEPLNLRFTKERDGPYADNLGNVLRRFEGHFTLGFDHRRNSPTMPIKLIPHALKAVEDFASSHEASARLDRVTQLIDGFETPRGLELLATVHWVVSHPEEQATDLHSVIRAVHCWNERKQRNMKPEQLRIAWERLRETGWL